MTAYAEQSPIKELHQILEYPQDNDQAPLTDEQVDRVKHLIEEDSQLLNHKNEEDGQDAIFKATLIGNLPLVKWFVKKGASVHTTEAEGYTLVDGASFQGRVDVLKYLHEEHKLDVNTKHADGYYPIHRACWGPEGARYGEVVEYLVGQGVSPMQVDGVEDMHCYQHTNNRETMKVIRKFRPGIDDEDDI